MIKFQKLTIKLPLIIISMITALIIMLIIASNISVSKNMTKIRYEGFNNTISGYAELIDYWFESQVLLLDIFAEASQFRDFLEVQDDLSREIALEKLIDLKKLNKYAINLALVDINGNILLDSDNRAVIGKNFFEINSDMESILKNSKDGVFSEKLIKSFVTQKWAIISAIKMYSTTDRNKLVGYMYILLDWETLNKDFLEKLVIGETGVVYAMTSDGTIVMNSKSSLLNEKGPNELLVGFKNKQGIQEYDFNGGKRISAYKLLNNMNWILGVAIAKSEIQKVTIETLIIITIVAIIALIIISIFIVLYIKSITSPLSKITKTARKIADGNLKPFKKSIVRNDELGELANAFFDMRESIANIIHKVIDSADQITNAAKDLSEQNNALSSRTESQAASIEETSASMNEIANTIKISSEESVSGNRMIIESKDAIQNAGNIILETTQNIEEVHEASSKIKDITKLIEDIAFQTNILALNASVEAARAGEQGKGFAVVASEVRNLAQNTQTSVKNITDLIDNVYIKIDKATESARESQAIFVDIQNTIDKASQIMQNISNGAIEQEEGVNQIKIAVQEMDNMTQKNAMLVQEATVSAEILFKQSEKLNDAVSLFKLE